MSLTKKSTCPELTRAGHLQMWLGLEPSYAVHLVKLVWARLAVDAGNKAELMQPSVATGCLSGCR